MAKALVFAGQGAQFVGMGKDLAEAYPACRALYDKADEVLGYGLSSICFEGPDDQLTKSNHCQPAIFVTSMACLAALDAKGSRGDVVGVAGLSLGEWSALHMAGALTFEDTLRVLEARGRFMQEACEATQGGMVSVMGLPEAEVRAVAEEAGVEVANLNSSAQIVLSGERDKIVAAEALAKERKAKKTVILNVAGAFHSSLMAPAADKLAAVLSDVAFQAPTIPVLSNVTGAPHGAVDDIRANMIKQVTSSVRWLSCVEWFQAQGVTSYLECGPGRVLSGLIKRIDRSAALANIQDLDSLEAATSQN